MTGTLYLVSRTGGESPHPLREWVTCYTIPYVGRIQRKPHSYLATSRTKLPVRQSRPAGRGQIELLRGKKKKSFRRNRVIVGHTYAEMRRRLIYFRGMGGRRESNLAREMAKARGGASPVYVRRTSIRTQLYVLHGIRGCKS